MEEIVSHDIRFYRIGECKRCGACERSPCPHLTWEDGLATCKTYGKGDYLEWNCHIFPDSPFCDVVVDEICGFKFVPVTRDDDKTYKKMLEGVKRRRLERLSE